MGKSYCSECGTELVDFAKFCPNCGTKVDDDYSQDIEQLSENSSTLSRKEVTRIVIKSMGAQGVSGIDNTKLTEKLLYFYDNNISVPERINTLMETL